MTAKENCLRTSDALCAAEVLLILQSRLMIMSVYAAVDALRRKTSTYAIYADMNMNAKESCLQTSSARSAVGEQKISAWHNNLQPMICGIIMV